MHHTEGGHFEQHLSGIEHEKDSVTLVEELLCWIGRCTRSDWVVECHHHAIDADRGQRDHLEAARLGEKDGA